LLSDPNDIINEISELHRNNADGATPTGAEVMQEKKADRRTRETVRDLGENVREAAGRAQQSSARAAEGFREYQLKLISAAQANANALLQCTTLLGPSGRIDYAFAATI
jgi:hypothetical protein